MNKWKNAHWCKVRKSTITLVNIVTYIGIKFLLRNKWIDFQLFTSSFLESTLFYEYIYIVKTDMNLILFIFILQNIGTVTYVRT